MAKIVLYKQDPSKVCEKVLIAIFILFPIILVQDQMLKIKDT